MSKLTLVILPLLFASVSLAQEVEWRTFAPEECNFSVEMPADPELRSETREYQGQPIRSFIYTAQAETVIYAINCSDYPVAKMLDTREKVLTMLEESAKARVRAESADLKEVDVNGYPGIEYVERIGNAAIYHRAYVVGEKLYQLDVGDVQGDGQAGAAKFFQSFSVE